MADYITKIRTLQGDKQYDHGSLANLPTWSLINDITTTEEVTKILLLDDLELYGDVLILFEGAIAESSTQTNSQLLVTYGDNGGSSLFYGVNGGITKNKSYAYHKIQRLMENTFFNIHKANGYRNDLQCDTLSSTNISNPESIKKVWLATQYDIPFAIGAKVKVYAKTR